jgi:hypothetical protein
MASHAGDDAAKVALPQHDVNVEPCW